MEINVKEAKSILTPQHSGFLATGPYPFTHALSGYVGCGFGQTTCGQYCYAQFLPNWTFSGFSAPWGQAVQVKTNAAQLLDKALSAMKPAIRQKLRIFMSSTTDPYQPLERIYQVTRQCLEVFACYQDLDLLVIQTRGPLAERDLPLLLHIPYAWLSITIETNGQSYLKTVSPCLPYTSVEEFGLQLLHSGAHRLIVDTMMDGDGSGGKRTARSPFAQAEPTWARTSHAHRLYDHLCEKAGEAADYGKGLPLSTKRFATLTPCPACTVQFLFPCGPYARRCWLLACASRLAWRESLPPFERKDTLLACGGR